MAKSARLMLLKSGGAARSLQALIRAEQRYGAGWSLG